MAEAAVKRILLVDDDETLRRTLAEQLSQNGEYQCLEAGSGAEALSVAKTEKFDAVLLDVGLPDADGREVCQQLRKAQVSVPIIMVTASSGETDTIRGLDSGANDYIAKPFRLGELVARLKAHLRQHALSEDAVLVIGPYTFKPNVKMLIEEKQNKKIRLTEKETSILKYLYRAGQRAVGPAAQPPGREGEQDVEDDRVGHGDQRQAEHERPRVGRDDQPGQAVGEAHRHEQRAEAVLRAPLPRAQAGGDRRAADDRPEDRDQVAVVAADAVDRHRERDGGGDETQRGEDDQRALQAWRRSRQGSSQAS
jgi:DNA-binding response OmpR family regulator